VTKLATVQMVPLVIFIANVNVVTKLTIDLLVIMITFVIKINSIPFLTMVILYYGYQIYQCSCGYGVYHWSHTELDYYDYAKYRRVFKPTVISYLAHSFCLLSFLPPAFSVPHSLVLSPFSLSVTSSTLSL